MKNKIVSMVLAMSVSLLLTSIATAELPMGTTTVTSGAVSSFTPQTLGITNQFAPAQIVYAYDQFTTCVDQNGNPVAIESLKSGTSVMIYHQTEGDKQIIRQVVVMGTKVKIVGSL